MEIKEALGQLDTMDDEQWTTDGLPKTEAVSEIMGEKVTRQQITEAAPKFTRENTDLEEVGQVDPDSAEQEPEQESAEPADISALEQFADSDPMLPHEFQAEILNKTDPRVLPQLDKMLAEQLISIAEKETQLEEIKRRTKQNRAMTQLYIKRLVPDLSNQEAIQEYIKSSTQRRADKADAIQEVLGGLKPSDLAKLDPRSPIDRAFARKTGRGGNRPKR